MIRQTGIWLMIGVLGGVSPLAYGQFGEKDAKKAAAAPGIAPDNTRANKADQKTAAPTAQEQSNAKADLELAAAVRKAITSDKSLSVYARNVKIIAKDGALTLRGPVRSGDEKTKVVELARQSAGTEKVNDQMSIKKPKPGKTPVS